MKTCCGEDRTTPYCPNCGKMLLEHGLLTLLEHCKKTLAHLSKRVRRDELYLEGVDPDDKMRVVSYDRDLRRSNDLAQKWEAWCRELAELIAGDSS